MGQDAVLAAHLHRCTNRLSQDHVPPFFRFSCHFCREGVFDQELMLNAQISVFVQLNPRSGLGSKCAIRHVGTAMAAVREYLTKGVFCAKSQSFGLSFPLFLSKKEREGETKR